MFLYAGSKRTPFTFEVFYQKIQFTHFMFLHHHNSFPHAIESVHFSFTNSSDKLLNTILTYYFENA